MRDQPSPHARGIQRRCPCAPNQGLRVGSVRAVKTPEPTSPTPGCPWRGIHIVSGLMISTFAAVFLGGLVLVIGGWETTDTLPLWVTAVMQIPLWAGLLGVPWWVVRRRKLSWKTDLGWQFQKKDVLSGLGIGVLAQAVFVPLVYLPVILLKDDLDVSGPRTHQPSSRTRHHPPSACGGSRRTNNRRNLFSRRNPPLLRKSILPPHRTTGQRPGIWLNPLAAPAVPRIIYVRARGRKAHPKRWPPRTSNLGSRGF